MNVLSICKTVKKKHKSKKKWKKRKSNKILTRKLTATIALDNIQLIFSEMSGNCFWNNYYSAFQWRNNYLNFWNASTNLQSPNNPIKRNTRIRGFKKKSVAIMDTDSCSNEVQECIRDFNCITLDSNGDSTSSFSQNISHSSIGEDNSSECSNNIEVSEEMIKFIEINMRHKADLEAEKERLRKLRKAAVKEERDDIEECEIPTEAKSNDCRSQEMNDLYGKSAPMIHGMETAIQLTFNWNCDHHKPQYWPILPFTFKFNKR